VFDCSCRIKRIEQIDELETEKSAEYRDMEMMEEENSSLRLQLQDLQARYTALKKFALQRNIPIPPELD
jgi:transcription factor MAFF/G/K